MLMRNRYVSNDSVFKGKVKKLCEEWNNNIALGTAKSRAQTFNKRVLQMRMDTGTDSWKHHLIGMVRDLNPR